MPEGHTIHRLARLHSEYFAGGPVAVSSPQGRFVDAELVDGRVMESASAVGKHLFHHYEGGVLVHVHLGLYGAFGHRAVENAEPEVVGQVRMRLMGRGGSDPSGPLWVADLRGPTRCEVLDPSGRDRILQRLGPDPLDPSADPRRAREKICRSARPIGALLMDQAVLAGVGNVYRAEVLFRLGIDPFRRGRDVTARMVADIWDDLALLMPIGVATGGIVTIRAEHDHGDLPRRGADRPRNYVYQRDGLPCRICGDLIRVTDMAGRSLYWCPTCQFGDA